MSASDPTQLVAELADWKAKAETAEAALSRLALSSLNFGNGAGLGKCAVCKYWKQTPNTTSNGDPKPQGNCHRHPPGDSGSFPTTHFTDFCGEFTL